MRLAALVVLAGCGRFGFGEVPGGEVDAGPLGPDGPLVTAECDPEVGSDTVALFGFDTDLAADASHRQVGTVVGAAGPGGSRCGSGSVELAGGHVRIADSPAFDLEEGSVELFFRTPNPVLGQAILSRDALNTNFDGHFTIGLSDGRLWVRMQRMGDLAVIRCAGVIPTDQWMHVGVSFGPPGYRLWLDHVEQTGQSIDLFGGSHDCSLPHTFGIAGNDNVLVIGGSLMTAADSDPMPTPEIPFSGSVDHLHVRSTWRDFSRF